MGTVSRASVDRFIDEHAKHPHYRSPRGIERHARSWQTEAPLRMLLNNLDADVAECPEDLVVYGGTGQAARTPESVRAIVEALLDLRDDQSLLIQSGKPVGILRSHVDAPRVLIANSNLVPHWATWEHFEGLRERGLIMYGQMTAGSWIYIGTQGILQGTFETFAEMARLHHGGSLAGKLVVTAGLGGMGGAQPLAVTLNGGVVLAAEIDPSRAAKRIETQYLDKVTDSYQQAKSWALAAIEKKEALSVAVICHAETLLKHLVDDGLTPDAVTDQTSAHDPLNGYIPTGYDTGAASELRQESPDRYRDLSLASMARHVGLMLILRERGAVTFDYGNNIREFARQGGEEAAFDIPGFVPEFIRPLFCEGKGPFRWVALSGDPDDIARTDEALMKAFPDNKRLHRWLDAAQRHVTFQGLPARICWLGLGERERAGIAFNDLVRDGTVKAPLVIGRDHLDAGSVASPFRETEGMRDGSDAISDWPLLNLLGNTVGGATWVSFHHGGGVGMGYSQHAGMVVVADGTDAAERRLRRVLYNDPAMGVLRHLDAGYPEAEACMARLDTTR